MLSDHKLIMIKMIVATFIMRSHPGVHGMLILLFHCLFCILTGCSFMNKGSWDIHDTFFYDSIQLILAVK
jgi:hypothetical protein